MHTYKGSYDKAIYVIRDGAGSNTLVVTLYVANEINVTTTSVKITTQS